MINSFMFTAGQALTAFTASSKGRVNNVCNKTDSFTYYHNGSGALPSSGDFVYEAVDEGSFPLAAGSYRINNSYFTITNLSSGEVSSVNLCPF